MQDLFHSDVPNASLNENILNPHASRMQQRVRQAIQRFPRLKKCTIFKDDDSFGLTLSWPDGEADKSKQAVQRFINSYPIGPPLPLPATTVVQSFSPTSRRTASLIVEEGGGDGASDKKKFRVEVWDILKGQIASVQVEDVHGAFLAGEGVAWHDSEEVFAYVADKKAPSATPPTPDSFQYREDWGEQYEGVVSPTIFLFDISSLKALPAVTDNTRTQLQPSFAPVTPQSPPNVFALAYTVVDDDPFKLGIVYCAQRAAEIRLAKFQRSTSPGEIKCLSDSTVSNPMKPALNVARSPRFTSDGKILFFLSSPKFDTHQGAMQVSAVDCSAATLDVCSPVRIVVDRQSSTQEREEGEDSYPSLYLEAFPSQCVWKSTLYLTTVHYSRRRILSVDLMTGKQKWIGEGAANEPDTLTKRQKSSSTNITSNDVSRAVLAVSPGTGKILILENSMRNPGIIKWLDAESPVYDIGIQVNHQLTCEILEHNGGSNDHYESILMYPKRKDDNEKLGLILYPHGGPHSAMTTDYSAELALLSEELRAGILFVNYRGSIGPDFRETVETLPGKAGTQDVGDCIQALEEVLEQYVHVFDSTRLGVMGGSHGGFLTAHLIGQYPELFRGAVMRNPVTEIAAMSTVTDIPDWCFVEALGIGSFDFDKFSTFPPDPKAYKAMFESSPMRYVDVVKTPVLIAIGDKDRRVPPSQGLAYYRALKVRGKEATLMRYPKDSHPIDRAASNEVQWTASIEFMRKLIGRSAESDVATGT